MFKGQQHESRKSLSLLLTLEHAYCKKSQLLRGTFCFTQVQGPNALTTLLHLADALLLDLFTLTSIKFYHDGCNQWGGGWPLTFKLVNHSRTWTFKNNKYFTLVPKDTLFWGSFYSLNIKHPSIFSFLGILNPKQVTNVLFSLFFDTLTNFVFCLGGCCLFFVFDLSK